MSDAGTHECSADSDYVFRCMTCERETDDEIAALRARIEELERERDEWARRAVGADHDRSGEYGDRLAAEADRDRWRQTAGRLAAAVAAYKRAHDGYCEAYDSADDGHWGPRMMDAHKSRDEAEAHMFAALAECAAATGGGE